MKKSKETETKEKRENFVEGVDYYFENGLMVLTVQFLLKRGYCCDNGCRHCPFNEKKQIKS